MRTSTADLRTWLMANNVMWRADLYTITLVDGTIHRWTTADYPLAVDGYDYGSAGIVLGRGAVKQSARLQVDTLEVRLAGAATLGSSAIGLLAAQGYFDDARLKLDHLIMPTPGDVSLGAIPSWFEGRIADVVPGADVVTLTVKSEVEALNVSIPRHLYSPACMFTAYDANCGVSKAANTVTGLVAASPTPTTAVVGSNLTAHVDNYYNLGVMTFSGNVTAALTGLRRPVRSYAQSGGVFTLSMRLPVAPAVGDQFTVYPGCSKTWTTCDQVFANTARFRGFPHVPASEGGE